MSEIEFRNALIVNPDLLEEGLVFKEQEVKINRQSCDLLFVDKDGNDVYVDVKLKVTDRTIGQLILHARLVKDPTTRFMIVGCSEQMVIKIREKVEQRQRRNAKTIKKIAYLVFEKDDLKKRLQRMEEDQNAVRTEVYDTIERSPDISSEALK